MNVEMDQLGRKVLFWAVLGPFFVALTHFLIFFNTPHSPMCIPLILLAGIPLCWKWGIKGLPVLLILILGSVAYIYSQLPIEDRFWFVGLAISSSLTLLIMALSFEEVTATVSNTASEAKIHLKSAVDFDEQIQKMRKEMKAERNAFNDQLLWQQELAKTARKDFLKLNKEKEKLELELAKK